MSHVIGLDGWLWRSALRDVAIGFSFWLAFFLVASFLEHTRFAFFAFPAPVLLGVGVARWLTLGLGPLLVGAVYPVSWFAWSALFQRLDFPDGIGLAWVVAFLVGAIPSQAFRQGRARQRATVRHPD